jgi:DNA-binding NarL/FixJ family response regulator
VQAAVQRTRILLVEMPRMLSDIITDAVNHSSDLEVVDVLPDRSSMSEVVTMKRADVVVLRLRNDELPDECEECRAVLNAHPRMKVLGVSADSHRTFLFELRPKLSAIGEVSPEELLDAIRAALPNPVPRT